MSVGMQLSVICAEDYPRITRRTTTRASRRDSIFGTLSHERPHEGVRVLADGQRPPGVLRAGGVVGAGARSVRRSRSGDAAELGRSVAPHLPNARHIVVPGTGHGAIGTGCGMRIVRDFIERGSAEASNTSCLRSLKRPPFFLSPAGPDPDRRPGSPRNDPRRRICGSASAR